MKRSNERNIDGWIATPEQRVAWEEGLIILEQVKALLPAFREQCPDFADWADARESEADGIAESFRFFLSCERVPSACPFAAWIDHPPILLKEVRHWAESLSVKLEEEQSCTPQKTLLPCQTALW
jgi:hypothetical protein